MVRAIAVVVVLFVLAAPRADAAPTDCMGVAPDGMAKCTAPLISPQVYGACIQTGLAYPINAYDRCYARIVGSGNPMTSEGQVVSVIQCLPPETTPGSPTPNVNLNWAPSGQTVVDNNLCWTITATWKYGLEMRGWAYETAQELNYGWNVMARRDRTAVCPRGYASVGADPYYPDYCIKRPCLWCEFVGNPLGIATGEKHVFESDYSGASAFPLRFTRSYSNLGHYRPLLNATEQMPGFGDFWRHSYNHRLLPEGAGSYLWVSVLRPNGSEKHFRADGKEVLNIDGRAGDSLSAYGTSGWLFRAASGQFEIYAANGFLTGLVDSAGRTQTLTYSDASTPPSIAPTAGLLIGVSDPFGRTLAFTYDGSSRLRTMTDPAGGVYQYTFDANQMLTRVDYPDSSFRTYIYNETGPWASAGGPYAISGIFDENGARYATYRYRDEYWNTPDSTEHGNGVEKYSRYPTFYDSNPQGGVVSVIDPLGTTHNYSVSPTSGVFRVTGQAQPAGSGSAASSNARVLDANGNVTSSDDFNGSRTCRAFDVATNRETGRVEGLASSVTCSSVTANGSTLPAGSRKITTNWHPDWPLAIKVAEPGRYTTKVYNGQPDPFASNATASCAPASSLLPDGKPIVVLCKQVEQATTDADGHLGMSATLQSGVVNRVQSWTYNGLGQILTAKDPLNNTTTYAYYTDTTTTHTVGDLQTVTNAKGQVTTHGKYNKHGQLLESTDANGVLAANAYDARLRLLSTSVGGQATTYAYDLAGQLVRVTQPDASYIGYEYDAAHRQKAVFDSRGNRIDYTLDNMGNKTAESVKDPGGTLLRSITRVYDALNRLQTVTGAVQ